jgi:hypothetical protein
MHHSQENVMTNETPHEGNLSAAGRASPTAGRTSRKPAKPATLSTRIAMAHRAAAQLRANLLLNRVRIRAGRGWESALCPTMPQSGWLAATEHDFMAWLDAGGFAAPGELPTAPGVETKTAA